MTAIDPQAPTLEQLQGSKPSFAPLADTEARTRRLQGALAKRILVLDGATGTAMQSLDLGPEHFGGEELEGCNEILVASHEEACLFVHRQYLEAGADIVETNTFGGTPLVLAEYGLADRTFELNKRAAELSRQACSEFDTPEKPRFVCGSVGPTTKAISVTGGVTFEELIENYRLQALGLLAGGADYLLLETCQDTRNIKAGLIGFDLAFEESGFSLPVAISVTIETMGTMLAGQDAEAFAVSVRHRDLLYVGLNCATGPDLMGDPLRTLSELCRTRIACVPNAGLPDEDGLYTEGPRDFEVVFSRFLEAGWLNLVGGCCGTTKDHVTALVKLVEGAAPRPVPGLDCDAPSRAMVSGLEAVHLTEDNRPLLVGERTNVLGSRKFKQLIQKGDFEAAAEVGRAQVKGGAQVVDVCLQDPDRDEIADVERFLDQIIRRVKVPLMIDSTDAAVMERALTFCQGKSILNSINLEDGEERFERVTELARRFGCALVVGLIDEAGMAVSLERKREVAQRCYDLLTRRYGIEPEDIWWDPLVFPCGTGDENYIGSAKATIEGVALMGELFPTTRSILGISNVSFGLPNAGREVLNSVFLFHCTRAGLDAAIVNTQRLARYAEIPESERALAERLLELEVGDVAGATRAVEEFTEAFRGRKTEMLASEREALPLAERLGRNVIEGSKEGLLEDLDKALAAEDYPEPLDIINGPLMAGMAEVGRLFNDNELIVAEVLQSAEVMKSAVGHLEPHMESSGNTATRGKVVLATVKGDVHDIGKNLVDIILSNNGFEVINLGIKVPSEQLIQAVREHKPDVVGLSGLLVKSAQMMVQTAADFRASGIQTDLLVGGAALTRRFTHKRIAAEYEGLCTYAKDAMHGLALVETLTDPDRRGELARDVETQVAADQAGPEKKTKENGIAGTTRSASVSRDVVVPTPRDTDRHIEELDLNQVWPLLNPQMLYGKHLGFKGSVFQELEAGAAKSETFLKLERVVKEVKRECCSGDQDLRMTARGVWQFFPAKSSGNRLELLDPQSGDPVASWDLPRQAKQDGLCLSDYVLEDDHVALFVVTAGAGVRERAEALKNSGEYLKSHTLAALALETAEAAAEWVHQRIRTAWGLVDDQDLTLRDVLAAKYQGKRYSFGYPACPDLAGQRALFATLGAEEIGVELTEGDMMDPEASVSALVFHHPEARYFGV